MSNLRKWQNLQREIMNLSILQLTVREKVCCLLRRKRNSDLQCAELKQTVIIIQQQNKELTRRMTDMEAEQQKARKKAQALDGIALLVEAAKDL